MTYGGETTWEPVVEMVLGSVCESVRGSVWESVEEET